MKYIYTVYPKEKTIILELDTPSVSASMSAYARTHGFIPKKEYHLTLVGYGPAVSFIEKNISVEILESIGKSVLFSITPQNKFSICKKVYTLDTDERESIIQHITLDGLETFKEKILETTGIHVDILPHITLFVKDSEKNKERKGIGINSNNEYGSYCIPLTIPKRFWFKRKTYGWGWTPATWEGWLTVGTYIALTFFIFYNTDTQSKLENHTILPTFLPFLGLTLALILISYLTGEKPHWQWGEKNSKEK